MPMIRVLLKKFLLGICVSFFSHWCTGVNTGQEATGGRIGLVDLQFKGRIKSGTWSGQEIG